MVLLKCQRHTKFFFLWVFFPIIHSLIIYKKKGGQDMENILLTHKFHDFLLTDENIQIAYDELWTAYSQNTPDVNPHFHFYLF